MTRGLADDRAERDARRTFVKDIIGGALSVAAIFATWQGVAWYALATAGAA